MPLQPILSLSDGYLQDAVSSENRTRSMSEGPVTADIKLIGDRPGGATSIESPLVSTTSAVMKAFGVTASFGINSTDANVPISMGIPAITIPRGGPSGRTHSLDEWTDIERSASVRWAEAALAIVVTAGGLE